MFLKNKGKSFPLALFKAAIAASCKFLAQNILANCVLEIFICRLNRVLFCVKQSSILAKNIKTTVTGHCES